MGGVPGSGPGGFGGGGQQNPNSVPGLLAQMLGEYQGTLPRQGQVRSDPRLLAAQMAALQQLGGLASAGGMDPQSKAMLQQALTQANIQQQGQQGAIQQQAQRQGVGGSGFDLASRLSAQQGGSNAGAMAATQAAADARARTLAALQNYAGLAGNVSGQQYGQAQQNFQNAFDIANARNNVRLGQANYATNQQNRQNQQLQGALGTAGQVVGGAFNYLNNPPGGSYGGGGTYGGTNPYGGVYPGYPNYPFP